MPLPRGFNWTDKVQQYTNYDYSYKAPSRDDINADKEDFKASEQVFSEWDWQNDKQLGPQGETLPEYAIGWKPTGEADFGTGLKGWWAKALSKTRAAWMEGYTEGLSIDIRYDVTQSQMKDGKVEEVTTEKGEVKTAAPKDQNQAYTFAAMNATKEMFNQALWGFLEGLGQAAVATERVIGTAGYTLADAIDPNRDINAETLKENWEASRMAYSGIFDASIYSEMNRRIDAGMRGDLAQQEIMMEKKWTMGPELLGQVVFDPLNMLSVIGKAGAQAKMVKNATKTFHTVANPEIAKMLDDLGDLSQMDNAVAYQKIDDLVRSQQALKAAASHAEDIATAGKDMDALSRSYKLASMTRDGKVGHLANETSEILMHIVNNSSPDEALEIIRGMVLSTSSDTAKAAEGVAAMMHFADPKALFSQAGNDTVVMLSRMAEKYGDTWLANLDNFKGKPVELTKDLLGKLDEVGQEMFPSVTSMREASEAVKAGKFANEAEKVKAMKLAEAYDKLPQYVKSATKFHDTAQKVVGPVNKLFVGAYMGWNPGYAFRNFSNNTLQLFIDYGPGILVGKADDIISKAEQLHGGVLLGQEGFGQAADIIGDAAKAEGATDIKGVGEALKKTTIKNGPAQILAGKFESNAAKRVIGRTYVDTFNKGTTAMVRGLTPQLRAAGFSDDIIKKLPTYIDQYSGNATDIIAALRSDISSGVIDVFNDISRIDPKYKGFLEKTGKWEEYTSKVLQASSREEALTASQKIFDDLAQAGDYVYREGRPAIDNYDKFLKSAESSGLPETRGQLISLRKTESRKAIQAAENILSEADDLGAKMRLPVGSLKKSRGITGLNTWGNDAAKEADRLSDLAWKLTKDAKGNGNVNQMWLAYPELFEGVPPAGLSRQTFLDALWSGYDRTVSKTWAGARDGAIDNVLSYLDDLKGAGAEIPQQWRDVIKTAQEGAQQYDNAMIGRFGELVEETPMVYGTRSTQIRTLANNSGIASVTEAGVPLDSKVLKTINKYADVNYKSLEDVPISVAEEAFAKKAGKIEQVTQEADEVAETIKAVNDPSRGFPHSGRPSLNTDADIQAIIEKGRMERAQREGLAHFDEAGSLVEPARKRILPPPTDGEAPTISRAIYEQMDSIKEMRAWVMDDVAQNFGKKQLVDKVADTALRTAERELTQKLAETKLISSRVAQANRDFTLLNYGDKSYWDVALAYLYPFHYWYKGTYANWVKRIAQNPAILAHYQRYKENLATVHAGMPDWWKSNINTNELFGLDMDNPLYFNLEATLWPLNGLTNTDFNDPSKRVNWWTYSLDFANKFGPSTWTPLNMMTGIALYNMGEKEAGEKWLGRGLPQSATIKAGASLLGVANLELDPIVNLITDDGLDPYERRRVSRALAQMEQEALRGELPYTPEQLQDAAYSQEGEIWEEAIKRAIRGRAPSQLSSFFFGVGFKGRTNEDMQVDAFYADQRKLFMMRPNLTPEEFREGMDALKQKYPFGDTVTLSSRDSVERDGSFAYMVMGRIPPGKSSEISQAAGIPPELFEKFYNSKGDLSKWSAADQQRFMSGVLNIAAVLEIPSDMTRGEWTDAKNAYSEMNTQAKQKFGDDILDLVDGYWQAKTVSYDKADTYLEKHPAVEEYLNWKAERVMGSPLLSAYYGGASTVENYWRSKQYADIESKLGKDIFDVVSEYQDLKTWGSPSEAKAYYRQHKAQISAYYELKEQWSTTILQETAKMAANLPEGQNAGVREDIDVTSPLAQDLAGALQPEQQMTYEDFSAVIPDRLMNLISDRVVNGENLPESAEKQLTRIANELGYNSVDDLVQDVGISMYAQP